MLYYLFLPIVSIILIALQSTVTDIVFFSRFVFEISLVAVIYAGFRLALVKGTILAFILGFILDCVGGSVLGLFALIYIIVFLCSFFISDWLDTEKTHVIVFFSFLCAFLKGIILNFFYYMAFNTDVLINDYSIIFIQALVMGLFAPLFFYLMDRTGIFIYETKV